MTTASLPLSFSPLHLISSHLLSPPSLFYPFTFGSSRLGLSFSLRHSGCFYGSPLFRSHPILSSTSARFWPRHSALFSLRYSLSCPARDIIHILLASYLTQCSWLPPTESLSDHEGALPQKPPKQWGTCISMHSPWSHGRSQVLRGTILVRTADPSPRTGVEHPFHHAGTGQKGSSDTTIDPARKALTGHGLDPRRWK